MAQHKTTAQIEPGRIEANIDTPLKHDTTLNFDYV